MNSYTSTIFSTGDNPGGETFNSIVNFQDIDNDNSRVSYIKFDTGLVVVSSKERKHSIRNKNNNNILERFLKLTVKSYSYKYKYDNTKEPTDLVNQRIINKSKKQNMGFILEELYELFPNCCSFYDNELLDDYIDDVNIINKKTTFKNKPKLEEVKDKIKNEGIIYDRVLLYFIMAFKEYYNKQQLKNEEFENKIKQLTNNKSNNKLNKSDYDNEFDYETKYKNLEKKHNKLEEKYAILLSRIINLENKL
jgi:hypothetical protein